MHKTVERGNSFKESLMSVPMKYVYSVFLCSRVSMAVANALDFVMLISTTEPALPSFWRYQTHKDQASDRPAEHKS